MLYKKFRLCAQVVGCITIGLLAVYGLVAVLGGGDLVAWASGRAAVAAGSVPSVMNYQGHLQDDSGVPLDGTYDMTFRIYESVDAPAALWAETHSDVTVREGYFSVLLGYSTPLPDSLFSTPDRYIGVTVAPYEEMTPRQRFASVPYAFHSWQADRAFGLSAADGDPADAVVVDSDGRVGIGTTTPKQRLHVNGDYYGRGHLYLYASEGDGANGTAYVQARDASLSSYIDLQFRTQYPGGIRDVMRLKDNGNVGIGTLHPTEKLDVNGNVRVSGDLNVAGNITNFNVTHYELHILAGDSDDRVMMDLTNSICYLTEVGYNVEVGLNGLRCAVTHDAGDGKWHLEGRNNQWGYLDCNASCLSW